MTSKRVPSPVYCPIAVTKESNQSNDVLIRIKNSILFGSLIYALTPKTKHEKAITAITEYPNVIILILSPNNSVFYLSSVYWMMSTKENLILKILI